MTLTAYCISDNFNFEPNKICQLKRLYCLVNATGSQMDSDTLYISYASNNVVMGQGSESAE